jgi:tetratricopeptide (TPR) repeat protein
MVLNSLGGVLQRLGKFDEAVTTFQKSYEISEKLGDERSLAMVLNSLGGVLHRQGKLDEAVTVFQRSYEISEKLGDERSLAMVLNSLGGVLQRLGKFNEAVTAFQKSYEIEKNLGDDRGQAMVLNSMGVVLSRQKKHEDAANAFNESIQIGRKLGDQSHLAKVYTAFGNSLFYQKKYQEAIIELINGFEIECSLKNLKGTQMVAPNLIQALINLNEFEEANKYIERALLLFPNNLKLLDLQRNIFPENINKQNQNNIIGIVKKLIHKPTGYLFGFIISEEINGEIFFNQKMLMKDDLPKIVVGLPVLFEIDPNSNNPKAKRVWLKD